MKTTLHRVALVSLASALAFSSCRKEPIENTNDYVDQTKSNEELQANGTITATLSGNKKEYTNLKDEKYEFENKVFAFCEDNFGAESVKMTTKDYYRSGYLSNNFEYTKQDFTITMYATSGEDEGDKENNDQITISFSIYDGKTLDQALSDEGYTLDEDPQDITIEYSVTYNPNEDSEDKSSIDRVSIEGSISPKWSTDKLQDRVSISDFEFDAETGAISFEFDGSDVDDEDNQENVEGTVKTTILVNQLLPKSSSVNNSSNNNSNNNNNNNSGSYTTVDVFSDGSEYYYYDGYNKVFLDYLGSGMYEDYNGNQYYDNEPEYESSSNDYSSYDYSSYDF